MLGYLEDADGRTWLHTGDLGRMDADGFFYFTVRSKRMIKSSGFNVYPAQVEAVLYGHSLVAEACVVGVPDPAQVERVKAYIVLKDDTQASSDTEAALIAHCRERLIKWVVPAGDRVSHGVATDPHRQDGLPGAGGGSHQASCAQ